MTEQYRAVILKADTISKNGIIYTVESLRKAAEKSSSLYYDEANKELYTLIDTPEDGKLFVERYCAKCGKPMKTTSKEFFLGRDCLGEHTETVWYWKCNACGYEEKKR